MRVAYFDCWAGASGDMILGALMGAGAALDRVNHGLGLLGLGVSISVAPVRRGGFAAVKASVDGPAGPGDHPHRGLSEIRRLLADSGLPDSVKARAVSVFERLAQAEAKVHGTGVETVHFHEVGAIDAIADVVGSCLCMADLGLDAVYFSPVPVGGGSVRSSHGTLPVPAPATLELLAGLAVWDPGEQHELVTPTGAAILTTLGTQCARWPSMRVESIGLGAGSRDTARPNILRAIVGAPISSGAEAGSGLAAGRDTVVVCETNVDDATGQVIAQAVDRLLTAGALDAWWSPAGMKKGRPGTKISFLSRPGDVCALVDLAFNELPTLGIRTHEVQRFVLDRAMETVETAYGPVRMKVGGSGKRVLTATPEFEDCRALAEARGIPVRTVIRAAEIARGALPVEPDKA
ncbi:MAG: TIGR00299 family protein [Firmicutes bacterium RBG_13_65_8]|nr:MAG: TIGR00299 family protein [Firmicutes bacterium RBG_13_65_8]